MKNQDSVITIDEIMGSGFLRYATAVNLHRSIPDVKDGCKPVQRRILYAMHKMGISSQSKHVKTQRVAGDVMGQFHPHGDQSVVDAIYKLVQWWVLRYPLIDGKGSFGSPNTDEDPPAAPRYTEVRLSPYGELMMGADLDDSIIDYALTYDDSQYEPSILPSMFPNIICNGQSGIGVAISSDMIPHNLTEVCEAIKHVAKKGSVTTDDLLSIIPGPDFPTGGIVVGTDGIKDYYQNGRGSIVVQGKVSISSEKSKSDTVTVTELPYGVKPSKFISEVVSLCESKKLDGISNINDSRGKGTEKIRIVIELKRGVNPHSIVSDLYEKTCLKSFIHINQTIISNGVPVLMSMEDLIKNYIDHRVDIVINRSKAELSANEKRSHLLKGVVKALSNIDKIISMIKKSNDRKEAREKIMKFLSIDKIQAEYILDLTISRLTRMAISEIKDELKILTARAKELKKIIKSKDLQIKIICKEVDEMSKKYGDERLTRIVDNDSEFSSVKDMVKKEDVVLVISNNGYYKKISKQEYDSNPQKHIRAVARRSVNDLQSFIINDNDSVIVFTNNGIYHRVPVINMNHSFSNKIETVSKLIDMKSGEEIVGVIYSNNDNDHVVTCSKNGIIKKSLLSEYLTRNNNGVGVSLRKKDSLKYVRLSNGDNEIIIATLKGRLLRYHEENIRSSNRASIGVIGVLLDKKDEVVSFNVVDSNSVSEVVIMSDNNFVKRGYIKDYSIGNRNNKGMIAINVNKKTGGLSKVVPIKNDDKNIHFITSDKKTIKIKKNDIKHQGRNTMGAKIDKLNDSVIADVLTNFFE